LGNGGLIAQSSSVGRPALKSRFLTQIKNVGVKYISDNVYDAVYVPYAQVISGIVLNDQYKNVIEKDVYRKINESNTGKPEFVISQHRILRRNT